jgi:hypothetical protein
MNKYRTQEWETKIIEACKDAHSMAHACASIGMNHNTFIVHAKRLGVYTTNQGGKGTNKPKPSIPLSEIIYKGIQPQYRSSNLRVRLIKEGIKEYKCEKCEKVEWMGKPIPLELHHLDGNSHNHLLENLQLLCPNCHTLTDNYGSKNKK